MTLIINNWSETFENADTRKRQRLKWVFIPTGCDSSGYIELMTLGERGVMALAVFTAMCQISGTLPADRRGKFVKSSGDPMKVCHIASLMRMPEKIVADAIDLLRKPEIAWLRIEENPENKRDSADSETESADNLPPICHQSPGFVKGEGQGEGQGEGEGQGTPKPPGGDCAVGSGVAEFEFVQGQIRGLQEIWESALTHFERASLERELASFANYPWQQVRDWLASNPDKIKTNRRDFIETGGVSEKGRAAEWARKQKPQLVSPVEF